MGTGEGCRKLHQRDPGQNSDGNGSYAYLRPESSHLEHLFSVFLSDGGAPKRRRARENFPRSPLLTGLDFILTSDVV